MNINWGIMGTGNIANTFADEFTYIKNGNIQAVASRSQERASKFAEKHKIQKAYKGYEMLVKDKDIDVIYIATPHNYHFENTILCLENNKSVLCEKPMAVNSNQLNDMIQMAKVKKLFLMEAMWTHFLPPIIKAKEWITQGKIGDIKLITAQFGFKAEVNASDRLFNPELAGGALLDVGIYTVFLTNLFLTDIPVEIEAAGYTGDTKVDEYDSIILKYKDGAIAQLTCSIQANLIDDAYIYGSKGSIHIPDFWKAQKVILDNQDGKEIFEDNRKSLGYNYEIEEVNKCLLNKEIESNIISFNDSKNSMKILDQVRKIINLKYPFE